MNAIQVANKVTFYTNRTKGNRYYFQEINDAVNDAIMKKIDSITNTDNPDRLKGIDRIQVMRDELWTLIKPSVSVPTIIGLYNENVTINHINFPSDYQVFAALTVTIDGIQQYGKDTNYNERGPLLDCSFRRPTNEKVYCLEDKTGLLIYRGVIGSITSASLDYIKIPLDFNMGNEANLINLGTGVLTINTSYIAYEDSVYNGILRQSGTLFSTNGVLTNLTSGQVILASLLTTIELPDKTHNEICKIAASILLGVNDDFEGSAFTEKESR